LPKLLFRINGEAEKEGKTYIVNHGCKWKIAESSNACQRWIGKMLSKTSVPHNFEFSFHQLWNELN
jgi:hypothetical protein